MNAQYKCLLTYSLTIPLYRVSKFVQHSFTWPSSKLEKDRNKNPFNWSIPTTLDFDIFYHSVLFLSETMWRTNYRNHNGNILSVNHFTGSKKGFICQTVFKAWERLFISKYIKRNSSGQYNVFIVPLFGLNKINVWLSFYEERWFFSLYWRKAIFCRWWTSYNLNIGS